MINIRGFKQLKAKSIKNIVSSDRIQELPESNAAEAVARSENMLPMAIHIKPYLRRIGDRLDNSGAAKAVPKMTEPSWIIIIMLESSNHSILATIRHLN